MVNQREILADANMAEAIGLPMKKRDGVPVTYAVPVKKRAPKIEQIKVQGAFKPEPVLAMSEYEEILRIMKSMTRVMEQSPHAFVKWGKRICGRISWCSSMVSMRARRPERRSTSRARRIL